MRPNRDLPSAPAGDLALVDACLAGSASAWATLVERFEATVYYAIRDAMRVHGRSPDEATLAELQAEVLFRVVRDDFARLRSYSGRCSLKHWFKVVASNYVVDTLRKRGPVGSLDDPALSGLAEGLADAAPPCDERLVRDEAVALLRELWAELAPDDRAFVRLFYEEERSAEEVAAAMHTTVGAIYTRKTRVIRRLRSLWRRRECTAPAYARSLP